MGKKSTYYKDSIPALIEKYKIVIKQCLDIISQSIDENITDDKLHNVLKSKRMASEDYKYYAKEIETLENEINNIYIEEKIEPKGAEKFTVEK